MGYNVFAVTPQHNKDGKNDATGAFIPGAKRFAGAYKGMYRTFENTPGHTRDNFIQTLKEGPGGLDMFAYFGHGWEGGLASAGIRTEKMDDFVQILYDKLNPGAVIVLYACYAGKINTFSTKLQEAVGKGVWIYGHTSLGHSFANPDVSEVQASRSPGWRELFKGELRAAWSEALHYTDMWLRFPLMWDEYIEKELNAIRLLGTWRTPDANQYHFTWSKTNGVYEDLDSMNKDPQGTVKDKNGREGSWTIIDDLEITWGYDDYETWTMPIKPTAQAIDGVPGVATRLKHDLPGKGQT